MHRPSNPAELGPRLRCLADAVLADQPVADLCCDHALLAIALVGEGKVPRAIAGDVASAPLVGAAQRIAAAGLGERIELRQGDGFRVLARADEVASVVIAGVGAPLAARMLADAQRERRLEGLRRLVVQVNDGFPRLAQLRIEIDAAGWGLVSERLVAENERIYLVMVAEPAPAGSRLGDAIDRELGPLLRRGEDPLFSSWRAREQARVQGVLARMAEGRPDPLRREQLERWRAMLDVSS